MGRILDTDQYPIKQNPSLSDYVIGTDSEQQGKTVNFPVGAFGEGGDGLQNNRFKIIKTGTAVTPTDVAALINAFNPTVEVLADEVPLFATIRPPQEKGESARLEYWGLTGVGKGVFGVGGDTTVLNTQPFIIESRTLNLFDPSDVENAVVIDFGAVADSDIQTFVDLINASGDTYVIEAGTNWYFQGNVGGDNVLYGWKGANGTFGNGGTTTTTNDLFLIEDNTGVNTQPSVTPSGFEKVVEGGNVGLRIIGRNPNNHGDIGSGAIDGTFNDIAGNFGATGTISVAFGQRVLASGYASFAHGFDIQATGTFTSIFGYQNSSNGYASFMQGYNNSEVSSTGFAFTAGINNQNGTNAGFMSGVALESSNGAATAILGAANIPIAGSNNGTSLTQPMIIVGCGTHTTPVGSPWTAVKRENLFVGLRNGEITAPITSPAVIDGEATGRIFVTREWVEAQNFLTIGQVGNLVVSESGNGYSIAGRDEANFGDVGVDAMDLSFSDSVSAVRGATGRNSFAAGRNVRAADIYTVAMGDTTWASAEGAVALGRFTEASGIGSMAINSVTEATGTDAFATGGSTRANGRGSMSAGVSNTAHSFGEAVFGHYATDYVPAGAETLSALDRIFTIGNGIIGTRADAFTVLGNGRIGIGINNFEADAGLERLKINGTVRATQLILDGLPIYADDAAAGAGGLATDTVYKTATGELRIKL